jgi:hypothetical protein
LVRGRTLTGMPSAKILRRLAVLSSLLILIAACSGPAPTPNPSNTAQPSRSAERTTLSVGNGTTIRVSVVVNGRAIGDVPAGATEDPISVALPDLPWTVELRSPGNRLLSTLAVDQGIDPKGPLGSGFVSRVHLPCGFLAVWAGSQTESPWTPVATGCGN